MDVQHPVTIELTPDEQQLLAKINFDPDTFQRGDKLYETIQQSCAAAKLLAVSLLERDAVAYSTPKRFMAAFGDMTFWNIC